MCDVYNADKHASFKHVFIMKLVCLPSLCEELACSPCACVGSLCVQKHAQVIWSRRCECERLSFPVSQPRVYPASRPYIAVTGSSPPQL